MSADEALIQALKTYVSKLSNTGKVLCPCSSSGMELLKRTSGYDLKEEFNVAGQLCSSGTGFATLPAFKDHVQKVGWSADFDPGSSGEAHHALFTVMIGSHANKKQRVQEAPFAGDEVSVPIMLMLEINPKAADPATYMSKNRLKEKFSDFPPSLYVPLYGSKATFMNKVVLVFEATADRSRSLAQCYRMATSIIRSLPSSESDVSHVRFVRKQEWDEWASRRPGWADKQLLQRIQGSPPEWMTEGHLNRRVEEEEKARQKEDLAAKADMTGQVADMASQISELKRQLTALSEGKEQRARERKAELQKQADTARSVDELEDLSRCLQVASLIDAGERDVQRRSDAFLKHSSLSRKLEEARRQQEQEQWVEKERRKDYEQRLAQVRAEEKAKANERAERLMSEWERDRDEERALAKKRAADREAKLEKLEKECEEAKRETEGYDPIAFSLLVCTDRHYKAMEEELEKDIRKKLKDRNLTDGYVKEFGRIDGLELREKGLKLNDGDLTIVTSAWQAGFWSKPSNDESPSTPGPMEELGLDAPFYAPWAFKKVGGMWQIREETEVLDFPDLKNMTEQEREVYKLRWIEHNSCHADFVKMLRNKYRKAVAQNILEYLLSQYVEYLTNTTGQKADTIPSKLWDYCEDREMLPLKKFQLLQQMNAPAGAVTTKDGNTAQSS